MPPLSRLLFLVTTLLVLFFFFFYFSLSTIPLAARPSLFPRSAIISLTDDNSTSFLARPAAFGPQVPGVEDGGLTGVLYIVEEGELGCGDGDEVEEEDEAVVVEDDDDNDDGNSGGELEWPVGLIDDDNDNDDEVRGVEVGVMEERRMRKKQMLKLKAGDDGDEEVEEFWSRSGSSAGRSRSLSLIRNRNKNRNNDRNSNRIKIRNKRKASESSPPPNPSLLPTTFISTPRPISEIPLTPPPLPPSPPLSLFENKIVLISRGECGFLAKVLWAQRRGALALIVGDNLKGRPLLTMYARGDTSNVTIPSLFTTYTTAHVLMSLVPPPPDTGKNKDDNGKVENGDGDGNGDGEGGLWLTLISTRGPASPFFDTLLVLVISPLVTLGVVYVMLTLRASIQRRRWRAPKSVVDSFPVRTYVTRAPHSSITPTITTTPSIGYSGRGVGAGGDRDARTARAGTGDLLQFSDDEQRRKSSNSPTSTPVPVLPPSHPHLDFDSPMVGGASSPPKPEEDIERNNIPHSNPRHQLPSITTPLLHTPLSPPPLPPSSHPFASTTTECVICLEDYISNVSRVMRLPCGHDFHVGCITPWLVTRRRTCPICKCDVVKAGGGRGSASNSNSNSTTTTHSQTTNSSTSNEEEERENDLESGDGGGGGSEISSNESWSESSAGERGSGMVRGLSGWRRIFAGVGLGLDLSNGRVGGRGIISSIVADGEDDGIYEGRRTGESTRSISRRRRRMLMMRESEGEDQNLQQQQLAVNEERSRNGDSHHFHHAQANAHDDDSFKDNIQDDNDDGDDDEDNDDARTPLLNPTDSSVLPVSL